MTREEFEKLYLEQYQQLVRFINRRVPGGGDDVLQDTYLHAIEHDTYKKNPKPGASAQVWLWYKVRREIYRQVAKDARYQKLLEEVEQAINLGQGGDLLAASSGLPGEPPLSGGGA